MHEKSFKRKIKLISVLCVIAVILSVHMSSYAVEYKFNMSYIYFGNPEDYLLQIHLIPIL